MPGPLRAVWLAKGEIPLRRIDFHIAYMHCISFSQQSLLGEVSYDY